MLIQNAMQDSQNFLSKTAVRMSQAPEAMTRVERDKEERVARKLELAGIDPAAVFSRSKREDYAGKQLTPQQEAIVSLQDRIAEVQNKMTEISADDSLSQKEKEEQLEKLGEQLKPLQETLQQQQEEDLEKFKAQKEQKERAEKHNQTAPPSDAAATSAEAMAADVNALTRAGAGLERAESALSLSAALQNDASVLTHDLNEYIEDQIRPLDNPPPAPEIVAKRQAESSATAHAAVRLENAAADAAKEATDALDQDEQKSAPVSAAHPDNDAKTLAQAQQIAHALDNEPPPQEMGNFVASE